MENITIIIIILFLLFVVVAVMYMNRAAIMGLIYGSASIIGGIFGGADEIPTIAIRDEWFAPLKEGKKTIEGRLNKGFFTTLKAGDKIKIKNQQGETVDAEIVAIRDYKSIKDYLKKEGLDKTLPGVKTIEEGVEVYRQYYKEEKEKKFGVLAFELKLL
jgi:ASC-1-like (ASCH) protein